ncbi:cytochrome P450 [Spirosoma flavus]
MTKAPTHKKIPKGPSAREAKRIIRAEPQKGWLELVLRYGKNFTYQGSLVTSDPVVVETLLMQRVHTQQRSGAYKLASWLIPGAPGVLFMDGEQWHKHVHAVMPVFTKAHIDAYPGLMHETVVQYITQWRDGQKLEDLYTCITKLGLQVVLQVGYGLDPDSELTQRFGQELMDYKLQTMTSRNRLEEFGFSLDQLQRIPGFAWQRLMLKRRVDRLNTHVQNILDERQRTNYQGQDWISLLHKAGFPLNQVTDELNHIYGAFNAIDYVITCGLYELSRQPEWVHTLRTELKEVLAGRSYPTRDDFAKLPNTINFMKEVFRFYPVGTAVLRKTGKSLDVAGAEWPQHREVMIFLQALHFHPDFWNKPEIFDPSRWEKPLREPRAYIPFLMGPRQCIGRHLAELHFVVTLNAILQYFTLQILQTDIALVPYLIPRFAQPMPTIVHSLT